MSARQTVTPEQALADLARTAQKARIAPPTKATQAEWHEQWVARNARGSVVFSCKTWNPEAERLARARAAVHGGIAELVAEGRRPA